MSAYRLEKDVRSAYYKSLGFKEGDKGTAHLQELIGAETVDIESLKQFCLHHTLPAYYRPTVWRLLLGVDPPYSDERTTLFVRKQRLQQFEDLVGALKVMKQLHYPPASFLSPPLSPSQAPPPPPPLSPEDFVLMFLLERNRLLFSVSSQMRQDRQLMLCQMARTFLALFSPEKKERSGEGKGVEGEETEGSEGPSGEEVGGGGGEVEGSEGGGERERLEVEAYWMFSRFACRWEEQLLRIYSLHSKWLQCLQEADHALYSHLVSLGLIAEEAGPSNGQGLPPAHTGLNRWISHCFAGVLPASCLESVWDKLVAGAPAVLAYVVVALLLALRPHILALGSADSITRLLMYRLPKDSLGLVGTKAIELWSAAVF